MLLQAEHKNLTDSGFRPFNCLICDHHHLEPLTNNRSFGVMFKKCTACGFIQSEYVSKKALSIYYDNFYRGQLTPPQIELARQKTHLQALSQMAYINEIVGELRFDKALEIGAADGALAKLLKNHTTHVYVTEADPNYARLLKAEKELRFIDEADFNRPKYNQFFDLIAISHVLEHLPNPLAAITQYARMLKPNGHLFIDLPNEAQMLVDTGFQANGHLSYFNPDTFLKMVAETDAFEVVECRTCNHSIEAFIASGFRMEEDYESTQTENGTVIRALLRRTKKSAQKPGTHVSETDDAKSLLDDYSARMVEMYHHNKTLRIRLGQLDKAFRLQADELADVQCRYTQLPEQTAPPNLPETSVLTPATITRLDAFLNRIRTEVYPEPPSLSHQAVTEKMMAHVFTKCHLKPNSKVLDVGCGQGLALDLFRQKGMQAQGITLGREDLIACKQKGHTVYEMDQSFLSFDDAVFDFIWCRHCIEHSIFPSFTLSELGRLLKSGSYTYIEVPAPETASRHESNPNHYSVLGKRMWGELIKRAGFSIVEVLDIALQVEAGPDMYWAFILKKDEQLKTP